MEGTVGDFKAQLGEHYFLFTGMNIRPFPVVSNSKNKILKTWDRPHSEAPYIVTAALAVYGNETGNNAHTT